MPNFTTKHTTPINRDTGIIANVISAGGSLIGNVIDNDIDLDTAAIGSIDLASGVSPAAGDSVELYILYSIDGASYEGIDDIEPLKVIGLQLDVAPHVISFAITMQPGKCKFAVKSESSQSVTATVTVKTFNPHHLQDA